MKKLLTVLAAVMTAAVTQILVPCPALAQSVAGAYIESDGTQEIDLGFVGSSSMTIELELAFPGGDAGTYQAVFGSRAESQVRNVSIMRTAGDKTLTADSNDCNSQGRTGNPYRMGPVGVAEDTRYRATLQGGKWTLTDVGTGSVVGAGGKAWDGEEFTTPGNMKLFSIDGVSINGSTWARVKARVYSLVVKDAAGNTLHNFEPRRRNGVAGLYDTEATSVPWKFSAIGNPLTYGPAVEVSQEATVSETAAQSSASVTVAPGQGGELTTIVCPVDSAHAYVESDGTQEIDLGFVGSSSMTIELELAFPGGDAGTYQAVFGSRAGDAQVRSLSILRKASAGTLTGDSNNVGSGSLSNPYRMEANDVAENTRYRAILRGGKWTLTDVCTGSVIGEGGKAWDGDEFTTSGNMKLFSIDGVTVDGSTWARTKARVYSLVIRDASGSTLHNFEPRRNKDGVAGLYDTEAASDESAWKFPTVGNQLTYGPTVALESDGTQEIDLGFVGSSLMTIELELAFPGGDAGTYQAVFGCRAESQVRNVSIMRTAGDKTLTADSNDCNSQGRTGNPYRMGPVGVAEDTRYRATLQGGKWTLTDVCTGSVVGEGGAAWDGEEFTTPGNMKLFSIGGVTVNGSTWARTKSRVYSLVVRDASGNTLHNFEPRRRKDGAAGLYDMVAASEDDAWKVSTIGNPLALIGASSFASDAPRAYTNVVGHIAESGTIPVTLSPLKPGTTYTWRAFIDDGKATDLSSLATFTTAADQAPAGAALSLHAEVAFGAARDGHLRLVLTRENTASAAAVTLVWGKAYGGADAGAWENTATVGTFAAGEKTIVVKTPLLAKDTTYLRAYTAGGEWSTTVFIPETGFVPGKAGLFIVVR